MLDEINDTYPKKQNTHLFQVHMEHSSGQIIFQATKQISIYLRRPTSYQESFRPQWCELKSITRKLEKKIIIWRINNMLFYNHWVTKENKKKILKTLETNENGNTTAQFIWDVAKAVLRGKFTVRQI